MRYGAVCILILLLGTPCAGQVRFSTLGALLSFADNNSPLVRQAALQAAASGEDAAVQASGLYPRLNSFATGDYYPIIATQVIPAEVLGGPKGTYLKAQFGLPYIFTAGLELSMPVVNLEKWTQVARSRALYAQAQRSREVAVENLHLQLTQTWYQYLAAREIAALNNENLETAAELMRIMAQRKQAGVVNPADYNRSHNLQLDAASAAANYDRNLQQLLHQLRYLSGIRTPDSFEVADSLKAFSWPVLSTAALEDRPGLPEARAKEQVALLALKESRRGALPKLNLNGRYAYNLQSKLERGSNDVSFDVSNINLRLDFPLFQGGYYRHLRKKNELLLEAAGLETARVRAQLEQQQDDWQSQYLAAREKYQILEEKLRSVSDNLRIARLSMQEGVMEFDEFNNIFMEYNRARIEYVQNLSDGVLYYLLSTHKF